MATGKKTRSKTNVVDEKSSEKQTNETSIGNVKDAANNENKPTDNEKNKVNDSNGDTEKPVSPSDNSDAYLEKSDPVPVEKKNENASPQFSPADISK